MDLTAKKQTRWFEEQVHPHDAQLKAYLRGSFPAVRDVDDVVQESYLRIWKAGAQHPIHSVKAFLFKVARGVAINALRKKRNAPFTGESTPAVTTVPDDAPDGRELVLRQERVGALADALMTLPPRCREIVILHKVQGHSQREVAEQLGLSERTIEGQVRIGVARCAAFLDKQRSRRTVA